MKPTASIDVCRRILRDSGSSFSLAFHILPPAKRDAMTAFYAFCRQVDDVVDQARDSDSARMAVQSWREKIGSMFLGETNDPVCGALGWAVAQFGIRREHLELILDGVERDLKVNRYRNFNDLYEYCYRVASAVGLVCVTVLGGISPEVEFYAELCGVAVQLTNILRDVGEDASLGRIYLPLEDLEAFGVPEEDFLDRRMTKALKRLLHFEACRARHFYDMARAALPPSLRHRLFFCEALRATYSRLLDCLIEEDFPVFNRCVSVGKSEKLAIVLKHRLHPATFLGVG